MESKLYRYLFQIGSNQKNSMKTVCVLKRFFSRTTKIFTTKIFDKTNKYILKYSIHTPPPKKKSIMINNGVTKLKKNCFRCVWTTLIYL